MNNNNKLVTQLENSLILTKNLFEEQKKYALSLSILLAEDKEILASFLNKNREQSFKIVNQKINRLKQLQDSDFEVQIHNKDLSTYIRSWNLTIKNVPLSSFRQGLVKVKESKKPLVSIELGKRLNIKAISPLFHNDKYIGSIEVIIGFKQLTKLLAQKGFSIFVLLKQKYLNIATELKNHKKIDHFVLVNQEQQNLNLFNNLQFNQLQDYGYLTNNQLAISYFSYYSLNREKLGYVIISSKNDSQIVIKSNYKKIQTVTKNGIIIE